MPGIEKCPIQKAAIVVVTHKVSSDRLPCAGRRNNLIGYCDPISGVMEVQQYDIKHQRRLSWDVTAYEDEKMKTTKIIFLHSPLKNNYGTEKCSFLYPFESDVA